MTYLEGKDRPGKGPGGPRAPSPVLRGVFRCSRARSTREHESACAGGVAQSASGAEMSGGQQGKGNAALAGSRRGGWAPRTS